VSPLLKTFAWRVIRRALATGERPGRYSSHIDQHCSYCRNIKNDIHLFFHCDLPKQVWSIATPPLPTDIIVAMKTEFNKLYLSLSLTIHQTLHCVKHYLLFGIYGKLAMIIAFKEKHGLHFKFNKQRQHTCIPTLVPFLNRSPKLCLLPLPIVNNLICKPVNSPTKV
jgi:hypothetical protein